MKDLSIAYEIRKRNAKKKMAEGGPVEKDSIDKFTERQMNKPKIKGVHTAIMPGDPGTSVAGSYHGSYGSNQEKSKILHKEKLEELRAMPKPKIEKLAQGGMVSSSVIKTKNLDKYGNIMEEDKPKKYEGMSEDKGPAEEEYMDDEMEPMYAEGGEVEEEEEQEGPEEHSSIAQAIMAQRKRKMMAEGGLVDIEENNEEEPNEYNDLDKAALKENMDSDFTDETEPEDSNTQSDDIDEDEHDMISKIRSKMRMKMAK